MKLIKTITVVALSLATAAISQALDIYIVGSNGDRSATQKGIETKLAAGGDWYFRGDKGVATRVSGVVTTESNALNSNYGVWTGTYNSTSVKIKVSFIGAAGAVYALAGNNQVRFVSNNGTGSGTLKSPYASDAALNTDYILANANFGFSTNFQETTPYNGGSYDTLVAETVGVSPLVFIASPGFPGTTITTQQAQNLYTAGSLPVSLFTGNYTADANKIVYAIGRNTDAGQRYAAYSEIGLGTSAAVQVWQPTFSGQLTDNATSIKYGGTVSSHQLWPIETVSGVNSGTRGNSGYDTGGNLAPALTVTGFSSNATHGRDTGSPTPTYEPYPSATNAYYIGYLTTGDYNTRIAPFSSAVLLKYNGVTYSDDAVRNGQYTAWVYNRILKRSDDVGVTDATISAFHDDLRDVITSTTATQNGGILVSTLNVERFADGGLVTPK